jgi:hypothetical protein
MYIREQFNDANVQSETTYKGRLYNNFVDTTDVQYEEKGV